MSQFALLVVFFLLAIHAVSARRERHHLKSRVIVDEAAVDRLEAYLFPNRTAAKYVNGRRLAIYKPPYVEDDVKCSFCARDMKYCSILGGLMIQEKYLPKNTNVKETCVVIEALGKRMSDEVFGHGRSFRDTPHCRDIVLQYLCLFYGGDSSQYLNYCIRQENVTSTGQANQELVPYPPCRSFCVQVATTCANDPTFIQTCNRIPCPPPKGYNGIELQCTPDPVLAAPGETAGSALDAHLGCEIPYHRTPYNAATPAYTLRSALLGAVVLLGVLFMF